MDTRNDLQRYSGLLCSVRIVLLVMVGVFGYDSNSLRITVRIEEDSVLDFRDREGVDSRIGVRSSLYASVQVHAVRNTHVKEDSSSSTCTGVLGAYCLLLYTIHEHMHTHTPCAPCFEYFECPHPSALQMILAYCLPTSHPLYELVPVPGTTVTLAVFLTHKQ